MCLVSCGLFIFLWGERVEGLWNVESMTVFFETISFRDVI